jgi:hypothetical protein
MVDGGNLDFEAGQALCHPMGPSAPGSERRCAACSAPGPDAGRSEHRPSRRREAGEAIAQSHRLAIPVASDDVGPASLPRRALPIEAVTPPDVNRATTLV